MTELKTAQGTDVVYTSVQLAASLLPAAGEWTLNHVAGALEELARSFVEHDAKPEIDHAMVVNEVREMNMAPESRDNILSQLENVNFSCRWVHSTFDPSVCGFKRM